MATYTYTTTNSIWAAHDSRPAMAPPPRPGSVPPQIPRHGQLRVTEQTVANVGRVPVPCEVYGEGTVRP